jgi:hypothetical protein
MGTAATMMRSNVEREARGNLALASLTFAALVLYLSWPLALHLSDALPSTPDDGAGSVWAELDRNLLAWILSWTAHATFSQPGQLFQANLFHPAPDALAFSEHLLGLLPLSAPIYASSSNPVLTYNLTTLIVIWANAVAVFLLVREWSRRATAGFVAGCLFALGSEIPLSFLRLHNSAIHFYPLIILLAWRAAASPRPLRLIGLAALTALQALSGFYAAYGLVVLAGIAAPFLFVRARRSGSTGFSPLGAIGVGLLPLLPVGLPYLRLRTSGHFPDLGEAQAAIARFSLSSAELSSLLLDELTLVGVVLAGVGLLASPVERGVRALLCAIGVGGFVLALGTNGGLPGDVLASPYELLMLTVPGFAAMRAPLRFLYLTQFALAALAGLGVAHILGEISKRTPTRERLAGLAFCGVAIVLVVIRSPAPPRPLDHAPLGPLYAGAHRWLAEHAAPGPVLELPTTASRMDGRHLRRLASSILGSTLHWFPMIDGYSGHEPASHALLMTLAQRLPDPRALADLCDLAELRWLIVHHRAAGPGSRALWAEAETSPDLTRRASLPTADIYEVECEEPGRGREALLKPEVAEQGPGLFTTGTWRAVGVLEPGRIGSVRITVRNQGEETWQGRRPPAPGTILVGATWIPVENGETTMVWTGQPLPHDLRAGESMELVLEGLTPPPGAYRLRLEIGPQGGPPFAALGESPLFGIPAARSAD